MCIITIIITTLKNFDMDHQLITNALIILLLVVKSTALKLKNLILLEAREIAISGREISIQK